LKYCRLNRNELGTYNAARGDESSRNCEAVCLTMDGSPTLRSCETCGWGW